MMPLMLMKVSEETHRQKMERTRKTRKPRYSPMVISESRKEEAANKILVLGKCGNVRAPILIDSGAAL